MDLRPCRIISGLELLLRDRYDQCRGWCLNSDTRKILLVISFCAGSVAQLVLSDFCCWVGFRVYSWLLVEQCLSMLLWTSGSRFEVLGEVSAFRWVLLCLWMVATILKSLSRLSSHNCSLLKLTPCTNQLIVTLIYLCAGTEEGSETLGPDSYLCISC